VHGTRGGAAVDFTSLGRPGSFYGGAIGRTEVTVEVDGYASVAFTVDVPEDDCGEAIGQQREVRLAKAGSTSAPLVVKGPERAACR
jgi:hypothetical protein